MFVIAIISAAIAGLALIDAGLAANSAKKSATAAYETASATKGLVEIETQRRADERAERDRDEEVRGLALEEADLAHLRLELEASKDGSFLVVCNDGPALAKDVVVEIMGVREVRRDNAATREPRWVSLH